MWVYPALPELAGCLHRPYISSVINKSNVAVWVPPRYIHSPISLNRERCWHGLKLEVKRFCKDNHVSTLTYHI